MLVRNHQTLEEISEIVGLDLDALRELKKSIGNPQLDRVD